MIRVRFAPSPTGSLHLGGARTALYNWLFAKQNKGTFVLRIEDTDLERSTQESTDQILQGMSYLRLSCDEGPFYQSKRLDIYQNHIDQLLSKNLAYRKEGAVYFKIPDCGNILFKDLILGEISNPASALEDFVIQKSDGYPVYHFAVVVDDSAMKITHVIRGMEHVSNTPRHILLFRALGFTEPLFAHMPMILGTDKKKLSKRHGAQSIQSYQESGFLPEAMVNFLARLGWGYKDEEIFSQSELLEKFNIEKVSKSPAVCDLKKLEWLNSHYIRSMPIDELQHICTAEPKILNLVRQRCQTLKDIPQQLAVIQNSPHQFDPKGIEKHFQNPDEVFERIEKYADIINASDSFDRETLDSQLRLLAEQLEIKPGQLIHPIRLALTGQTVGPGLFELMEVLGKKAVIERLRELRTKKLL